MVFGVFLVMVSPTTAEVANDVKIAHPDRMDIGPSVRDAPMKDLNQIASEALASGAALGKAVFHDLYAIGDNESFYTGSYGDGFIEFEKRGEGAYCEMWVATNLSFPEGDPRNDDPEKINITDEQVNYMIDEFDAVIYPNVTHYFGYPDNLTGENSLFESWEYPFFETEDPGKVMIMVFNIIDESYYDPEYPYFIAGFFSPTTELYYDRNIIHVDSYNWTGRTNGTDGKYDFEATIAHEFQHLVHNDLDPQEETWINEGCSMFAEFLCGYTDFWPYLQRYLYTPDNGLIDWADQGDINILADYGGPLMFMLYLNDHFGGVDTVSAIAQSTLTGIEGIEAVLAESEDYSDWTFNDVFRAFRLANLIHADQPGDGLYNYDSIDWSDPEAIDPSYTSLSFFSGIQLGSDFGTTWTFDGDDTGCTEVGSYGTDYIQITNMQSQAGNDGLKFHLDGWDEVPEGWELVPKSLAEGLLYLEDFNHGGALPDGWGTASYGPNVWPWEAVSEGGSDYAVWCNSDRAGPGTSIIERLYMDDVSVDISSAAYAENLYLQYFVDYSSFDGDEYGEVLISVDDGPWQVVKQYTSPTDYVGYELIDISSFVGGNELKVAFQYHGTWDWWMLVDDLSVSLEPLEEPPQEPPQEDYVWYSGVGDELDRMLIGNADLTGMEEATLTFDTLYQIEDNWDFGFVQVSTDGGESWVSLENEYTTNETDPSAMQSIIDNMPGLTGFSDGWVTMSFNLTEFVGQEIMFAFRYMTDWGYTEAGWLVDNVYIDGELIDDGMDVIGLSPAYPNTDWMVTIYCPANGMYPGLVFDLRLNHETETTLRSMSSLVYLYDTIYIIVSPTLGMSDYAFGFVYTGLLA